MSWFAIATWVGVAFVVVAAGVGRGRVFAIFAAVILGLQALLSIAMFRLFEPVWPLYAYFQLCAQLHFLSLVRARMRPTWWRVLLSWPGLWFSAGCFLALFWAIPAALGYEPWLPWLPWVGATFGLYQSLRAKPSTVDLVLDGADAGPHVVRCAHGNERHERPLRLVQITDPHLGPLMSAERLRGICARAVELSPDLILLTGDFLTMESRSDPAHIEHALEPLRAVGGRTFACLGNHDLEAPELVRDVLAHAEVQLLVDDSICVETPAGEVQIVGADFSFTRRAERLAALCRAHPRIDGALRLILLHDPGAFRHLPAGEGDLVLSGHTHGGQVGLLSLGLRWTVVSGFTSIPDHGFWARGADRMYVHRGTGVYGFPLRVGVPAEEGLIRVHRSR